jgi:hypothetical protein
MLLIASRVNQTGRTRSVSKAKMTDEPLARFRSLPNFITYCYTHTLPSVCEAIQMLRIDHRLLSQFGDVGSYDRIDVVDPTRPSPP